MLLENKSCGAMERKSEEQRVKKQEVIKLAQTDLPECAVGVPGRVGRSYDVIKWQTVI